MEGSEVDNDSRVRAWARILLKAVCAGAVAGLFALGSFTPAAATGAVVGCLAAGCYVAGYVSSHLHRQTAGRVFDSKVAGHAVVRLVLVALLGVGTYAGLGRPGVTAYLLALAVGFPVLVISEAPRATRQLRARGLIG